MNTNGLAKLYEHLSPKERLPLIIAASARGDETERNRLAHSAPTARFQLPNYYGWAEGMQLVSLFHLLELLEAAARNWQTAALLEQEESLGKKANPARRDRLEELTRITAYVFTVNMDGWKQFCSEFPIASPDLLLKDLPGYEAVKEAEEAARIVAFNAAEATAWIRKDGHETAEALTAEAVAASLWTFVNAAAERWARQTRRSVNIRACS